MTQCAHVSATSSQCPSTYSANSVDIVSVERLFLLRVRPTESVHAAASRELGIGPARIVVELRVRFAKSVVTTSGFLSIETSFQHCRCPKRKRNINIARQVETSFDEALSIGQAVKTSRPSRRTIGWPEEPLSGEIFRPVAPFLNPVGPAWPQLRRVCKLNGLGGN
jgi:hypothetical protein